MAQLVVIDFFKDAGKSCCLGRVQPLIERHWPFAKFEHRFLDNPDAGNRLKAEIDVETGEHLVNFVLEQHCPGAFAGNDQLSRLERVFVRGAPWPDYFFRSCIPRVKWPDNFRPSRQQIDAHARTAGNNRLKNQRCKFGDRPCLAKTVLRPAAHPLQSVAVALDFMLTILSLVAMKNPGSDPQASALLEWYDRHARPMPWRVPPALRKTGVRPDPYHVWLSEVMLQQTQVRTVVAYFLDFLQKWPNLSDLACENDDEVMKAWAGLGYYSRARNLKKCAQTVWRELGGAFPQTASGLAALPGIGPYTAAAIASIAFDEPVAVVDGNVERVVSRLFRIMEPMPQGKETVRAHVSAMLPMDRPGDFAQAMMDLGATLCSPRKPACSLCPLQNACRAASVGDAEAFPRKLAKRKKPARVGAAFVICNAKGEVFLEKRSDKGMLGGMAATPTTDWSVRGDGAIGASAAPMAGNWQRKGTIRHSFTHFDLELEVWQTQAAGPVPLPGWWAGGASLAGEALPTVMKKVIACAIPDAFDRISPAKGRQQ